MTKPLVLLDSNGGLLDVALMSEKAFNKSREHGGLWQQHGDTGRILPYRGTLIFTELVDKGRWYQTTVDVEVWKNQIGDDNGTDGGDVPGGVSVAEDRRPVPAGEWGTVLKGLVAIIQDRKLNRPEGSYTSYLFNAGESKIRKKTGEEAVELILATDRDELSSEAADLIYHLLVLLAELDIPFDDVIRELESRG